VNMKAASTKHDMTCEINWMKSEDKKRCCDCGDSVEPGKVFILLFELKIILIIKCFLMADVHFYFNYLTNFVSEAKFRLKLYFKMFYI
jgi:hypothetical protein